MVGRLFRVVLPVALLAGLLMPGAAGAGPDAALHGVASTNVEHVTFVPFEPYSATGARIVDKYLYVTSWKNLSIYDISTPEDPQLVSLTPFTPTAEEPTPDVHRFENEDVATDGKILIFSETGATLVGGGSNHYRVYDVTDKAAPRQIADLPGAAQHTMTCVDSCRYTYGSSGNIVDLTNPAEPKLVGNWVTKSGAKGGHDVREVAPGLVAVSSGEGAILDTSDPLNPRKIAVAGAGGAKPAHSTWWDGEDRFLLGAQETNLNARCTETIGATTVYDMTDYANGTYRLADLHRAKNGYALDGNPVANGLGCSSHWLEANPTFDNGGIFAQGYYEHGTRFFYVSGEGQLTPVGQFLPNGGSTSAVHWATDRVLYAIDYTRGFDVLRWNGPLTNNPGAATDVRGLSAARSGSAVTVSGVSSFAGEVAGATVATDAAGDGPGGEVSKTSGVDLVGATLRQPEAGYPYMEVTWKVTGLPGPDTAPATVPEAIRYVFAFAADETTFIVQAKLSNLAALTLADDPQGHATHVGRSFQLRGNCADLAVVSGNCAHVAWLDGEFDVVRKEVRARIPVGSAAAPAIKPGAAITPPSDQTAPFIYATYQAAVSNANTWDGADWDPDLVYSVPQGTVQLGIASAGADPASVAYGAPVPLEADGRFSKTFPSVPTGSEIFAKTCFGTACTTRSVGAG